MNRALFTLMGLNAKAWLRRTLRGARTVRGALLLLFTIGLLAMMIGPQVVSAVIMSGRPEMRSVSDATATVAPLVLLLFTLVSTFSAAGEAAIFFTPAEVDFLFAAPFSRRELLLYKLAKTLQALVLFSAFIALMMQMSLRSSAAGFVGIVLTLTMVHLVGMAGALVGQIVTESAYTRARKLILLGVAVAAAAGLADALRRLPAQVEDFGAILAAVRTSSVLDVVLAPFRVFTNAIFADSIVPGLVGWGAAALAIDAALLILVLKLDANYIESAATISQKVYDRIRRARQGGGFAMPVGGRAGRWSLPPLPWLAGAGPVAWRQALVVMRTSRQVLIMSAVMVSVAAAGFAFSSGTRGGQAASSAFPAVTLGMTAYMTFIFTMQLPWAFRGDVDHIDFLKTLPLRAIVLAAGELLGGVALLTMAHLVLFAGLTAASPPSWPIMLTAAAFCGPFNGLLVSTNNLLFLLYPVRHQVGSAVDFQIMGKMSLFMSLQFLLLLPLVGLPAAFGGVAYFLAGSSWWAFAITTWLLLAAELVPLVAGVSWAFQRFDVSTQTPA